jgi:hypothetical protein
MDIGCDLLAHCCLSQRVSLEITVNVMAYQQTRHSLGGSICPLSKHAQDGRPALCTFDTFSICFDRFRTEFESREDRERCIFSCCRLLWVHPEALFSGSGSVLRFGRRPARPWTGGRRDASPVRL